MASNFVRCINGHVFDTEKSSSCPKCGWVAGAAKFPPKSDNQDGDSDADDIKQRDRQKDWPPLPLLIDRRIILGGGIAIATATGFFFFRRSGSSVPEISNQPASEKTGAPSEPGLKKEAEAPHAGISHFRDLQPEDQVEQQQAAERLGLSRELIEAALALRASLLCEKPSPDSGSLRFLRKFVAEGHPRASQTAGILVRDGTGVGKDPNEAAQYLMVASIAGLARARFAYAELILDDPNSKKSDAVPWLLAAARAGMKEARQELAELSSPGTHFEPVGETVDDLNKAVAEGNWTEVARLSDAFALQKITAGLHFKGVCIYEGRGGLAADRNSAMAWFTAAVRNGWGPSCRYYADYARRNTESVNAAEIVGWYQVGRLSYCTDQEKSQFAFSIWESAGLLSADQWKDIRTLFAGLDVVAPA